MMVKKISNPIKITAAIVVLILGIIGTKYALLSNTKFDDKEVFVKIPHNATYEQAKKIISKYIDNYADFETVAKLRKYPANVKSGRFLFKKGMSSLSLTTALRHNIVVKLSFNNQERLEDLAGRASSQIEADSLSILQSFYDPQFLLHNGFNKETVFVICIPNTYEMYWNTTADEFRDKMLESYKDFWDNGRIDEANENNLTPIEATILASIVHKESVKADDRPKIAAVYLNRMKVEMPLQADPTNIYGRKKAANNFKLIIKQVLEGDLKIDSPYNTYTNLGLPPGPICMPDKSALEAVLNPDKNNYLYFCASVENFGCTEFAETYEQHLEIARKYREWVKKQGYKR
jgi:UPF0755 protein